MIDDLADDELRTRLQQRGIPDADIDALVAARDDHAATIAELLR